MRELQYFPPHLCYGEETLKLLAFLIIQFLEMMIFLKGMSLGGVVGGPMFSHIWTLLYQLECVIRLFL